ncbi:hypothetical protein [Streptococcus suis]|uniref:hypothetical protein n=1 Tax=Streptococcus suis TaxID=1307 RepID=UPI00209C100B|nr:hypothetical protein [Streptococcus suis]MCO8228341.1 hypothetical protein [Streptococcus suis]HEM3441763.1 hypothetical protein [Streptococcus suis]
MKILAIDPSSNKIKTSTTGIVLLDNAKLVNCWAISYGMKGFDDWFHEVGSSLEVDTVVIEKFEARDNDKSKDNSVLETIAYIQLCYPDAILQRNAGYKSDIPDNLLKMLKLWKFQKSHHQDIRAAARLGLFWAMRNDVEEVVQDIGRTVSEHKNQAQKVAS